MPAASADDWKLFYVYSICTVLNFLLIKFTNFYAIKQVRPPEDAGLFGEIPSILKYSEEAAAKREAVHKNTHENWLDVVVFWGALFFLFVQNLTGNGKSETLALTILYVVYTFGRYFWLISYAHGLQPWRTIGFMLANFSSAAAVTLLLAIAAQTDFTVLFSNNN